MIVWEDREVFVATVTGCEVQANFKEEFGSMGAKPLTNDQIHDIHACVQPGLASALPSN